MLKIRIQYTKAEEMYKALKTLKNEFNIISLNEDYKGKNPKYANSMYKTAYLDVERKNG